MRPDGIELLKNPPRLDNENYSSDLREFIAFILQGKPADRPTMADICKHPYIAQTEQQHPTRQLSEMVVTFKRWEEAGGQRASLFQPGGAAAVQAANIVFDNEDWNFSTSLGDDDEIVHVAPDLTLPETPAEISTPSTHLHRHRIPVRSYNMDNLTIKSNASSSAETGGDGSSIDAISSKIPQLNIEASPEGDDLSYEPQDHISVEQTGYTQDLDSFQYSLNEPLSHPSQHDSAIIQAHGATNEELSVMRGGRSLQAIFQPLTSDLPLRSGESTTMLSQELNYDAGVGPSGASIPTVDLSNVAQAKANAQNRRKTMEWTFPKADTSTVPEVPPAPRARPELKHSVTTPIGDINHDISGTLNLDDMWGDDLESAQSLSAYAFAGARQAAEVLETAPAADPTRAASSYAYMDLTHASESMYPDPPADKNRFSGIDLDAIMAMPSDDEGLAATPAANPALIGQGDNQGFT